MPDLFDLCEEPDPVGQAANMRRVKSRISKAVLDWCAGRVDRPFQLVDLTQNVLEAVPGTAPDSPGRIFRQLARDGLIDYRLLSRRESRYVVDAVR